MKREEITRNDLALLQYVRALANQIEREEEAYTIELQEWIEFAMKFGVVAKTTGTPGMITHVSTNGASTSTNAVPVPPAFPKQVERRDLEVMLAWARGEDILLHVLERE